MHWCGCGCVWLCGGGVDVCGCGVLVWWFVLYSGVYSKACIKVWWEKFKVVAAVTERFLGQPSNNTSPYTTLYCTTLYNNSNVRTFLNSTLLHYSVESGRVGLDR